MSDYHRPGGFKVLPDVVKNLLIINGLFFLATIVLEANFGIGLIDRLGLHFPTSDKFKPFQFITHLFMHGGFAHIFFNMFALWMFGSVLENVIGTRKFFIYYFVTGFGAALLHLIVTGFGIWHFESLFNEYATNPTLENFRQFVTEHIPSTYAPAYQNFIQSWAHNPGSSEYARSSIELVREFLEHKKDVPIVGASGAVFGLLLAFGMLFPNSHIYIYFLLPIKAKYFVILYGAAELYSGLANNPTDNVAHFAHLGGMLFGFILLKVWGLKRFN